MLPMQFFAKRSFAVTNVVSMAMYFGMFGSIFFPQPVHAERARQLAARGRPEAPGLDRATMIVAPLAGIFSEKFGPRWFMVTGVSLQAIALRLARHRGLDHDELRLDDRPVHPRGLRHGPGLRPLGERHPQLGPRRPGGSGIRRHQRDPRARRHLRHRRPRHRVQRRRRLHLAAGVSSTAWSRRFGSGRGADLRRLVAALLPFGGKATETEVEEFEEIEERDAPHGTRPSHPLPAAN